MKNKIKVGDTVTLKKSSQKMVVNEISPEKTVSCIWFSKKNDDIQMNEIVVDIQELIKVQPDY